MSLVTQHSCTLPAAAEPGRIQLVLPFLQSRIASGEDVFGPLIEKYLLANKHRVTVQLLPDQQLAAKEDEAEKAELAAFKQKLVDSELQDVIRSTQELKERQVTSPCLALVSLPVLFLGCAS